MAFMSRNRRSGTDNNQHRQQRPNKGGHVAPQKNIDVVASRHWHGTEKCSDKAFWRAAQAFRPSGNGHEGQRHHRQPLWIKKKLRNL